MSDINSGWYEEELWMRDFRDVEVYPYSDLDVVIFRSARYGDYEVPTKVSSAEATYALANYADYREGIDAGL